MLMPTTELAAPARMVALELVAHDASLWGDEADACYLCRGMGVRRRLRQFLRLPFQCGICHIVNRRGEVEF